MGSLRTGGAWWSWAPGPSKALVGRGTLQAAGVQVRAHDEALVCDLIPLDTLVFSKIPWPHFRLFLYFRTLKGPSLWILDYSGRNLSTQEEPSRNRIYIHRLGLRKAISLSSPMLLSCAGFCAGTINLPPDVSAAHSTGMLTTPEARLWKL